VGITFIYVTHDQEEALTMSDRIAIMHLGKVLQIGTPAEIYERPGCRFVADFVGDTNFLVGVVRGQEADLATILVDGSLPVLVQSDETLALGKQVTVAIRPEKIRLLRQPAPGEQNCFSCRLEQVVYVGTDTRYHVRLGENVSLAVREQNVLSAPDPDGFDTDSDTPAYAVWQSDAGRVLVD
jgi:spermidine/putrescine transport system ATP-binding protein